MDKPKFKIGDRVRFSTDANRVGIIDIIKRQDGKYNIEGLSERELLHICDCLGTNEVESDDHEFSTLADYVDDYCICFKLKKL